MYCVEERGVRLTLKGIAARIGMSVSTVSWVVNSPNDSFARKEVRSHVQAIIKEIDYTPNQNARAFKFGKDPPQEPSAGALACILGRVKTTEDSPFLAQLARVIEQRALGQGYPVRHSYSVFDVKISAIPGKIESFKADGAIILGRFSGNYIGFPEQQYKSLIYVDQNVTSADYDQIVCDGYEVTQIAMNYLITYSHRRIGYTGEISNGVRYQAYLDTLRENGLEYSRSLVSDCPQNGAGGYQGAEHLLRMASPSPAAMFCATDIAIIAALHRLTEVKIKVSEQLSLISMGSTELSRHASPTLTIMGVPVAEMGNMVVQTLVDRTQKWHKLLMEIFLPDGLAVRESAVNLSGGMYI